MIPDYRITSIVRSAQTVTTHSRAINRRQLTIAVKYVKYNVSTFPILLYCCRTQTVRQKNIFSVHIRMRISVCICVRACVCVHNATNARMIFVVSKVRRARRAKTFLSSVCQRACTCRRSRSCGGYRYKTLRLLSHQRRDFTLVSTTTTTTMTTTLPFFLLPLTFCLDDCNSCVLALSSP